MFKHAGTMLTKQNVAKLSCWLFYYKTADIFFSSSAFSFSFFYHLHKLILGHVEERNKECKITSFSQTSSASQFVWVFKSATSLTQLNSTSCASFTRSSANSFIRQRQLSSNEIHFRKQSTFIICSFFQALSGASSDVIVELAFNF